MAKSEVQVQEEKNANGNVNANELATPAPEKEVGGFTAADLLEEESAEKTEAEAFDPFHILDGLDDTGLLIERKSFNYGKDNRQCWSYFVAGTLRGQSLRANVNATDKGGYETLSLIFGGDPAVGLWYKRVVTRDDKGRITYSGNQYFAVSRDPEDGMIYSARIMPHEKSDQALLDMMIAKSLMKKQAGGAVQ